MQLDKIIKLLPGFLAQGLAIEIRGNSGIGKTDMIRQMVRDLNKSEGSWGIGTHYAAMWGPQDPTGFFVFGKQNVKQLDGTMKEQLVSEFATPTWLRADPGQEHQWMNEFKRGVMVLEEFDKANPEVKKSCAPLILDGGMHDNYLHSGIGRILLTNHANDGRQGSTKEQDFVISRKILLTATQSVAGWVDWATQNGVHPMFIAFAEEHVDVVFGGHLPEKQGPFMNCRTLVAGSRAAVSGLMDADGHILDDEAFHETMAGAFGGPGARDLVTFLKFKDEVPDWKDIVAKPDTAKLPNNPGGAMMAAHICAANVDDKTVEPAVKYVRRLPKNIHIVFAKAATRKNFRLTNSKAFVKWTTEAPELVALITALGTAR
jgi:RecA/RadA recombinase